MIGPPDKTGGLFLWAKAGVLADARVIEKSTCDCRYLYAAMKKFSLEEIQRRAIGQRFELALPMERAEFDSEARTVPMAVTSDQPIEHWFGELQLNHSPSAIRMQRVRGGAPLLLEHSRDKKIGGLTDWRTDGHVLRATAKFSRRPEAEAEWQDYQDGIARQVSGGFLLHHLVLVEEREDKPNLYRSDDWEPIEASLVSIPADTSVGIGRAMEDDDAARKEEICAECEGAGCDKCAPEDEQSERAAVQPSEIPPQPQIEVRNTQMDKDKELIAIGETFGEPELARTFALQGKSVEELRAAILAARTTAQAPTPTSPVELNEQETQQFSITRGINALLRNENCFEREVSQEIQKKLPAGVGYRGGLLVPTGFKRDRMSEAQKRALDVLTRAGLEVKTAAAGGRAVFSEYAGFLDLLRAKAKVIELGATVLPGLQGNPSFVRQATAGVAYWVTENPGSDVTQADATIELVTLSPKTLMAMTSFSRQLLAQSSFDIDNFVQNDLAKVNALAVDKAAIHGAANGLTGLYAESGVNAVAMGGVPTFAKVVDMETAVAEANADISTMAYLTTPGIRGKAKQTLEFSVNGSDKLWTDGEMNGYRAEVSNNISKVMLASAETGGTSHGIIFGAWDALLIGEWGAMEITADPYTLLGQGMVRVVSYMLIDEKVKYGPCFSKGTGLTTS